MQHIKQKMVVRGSQKKNVGYFRLIKMGRRDRGGGGGEARGALNVGKMRCRGG